MKKNVSQPIKIDNLSLDEVVCLFNNIYHKINEYNDSRRANDSGKQFYEWLGTLSSFVYEIRNFQFNYVPILKDNVKVDCCFKQTTQKRFFEYYKEAKEIEKEFDKIKERVERSHDEYNERRETRNNYHTSNPIVRNNMESKKFSFKNTKQFINSLIDEISRFHEFCRFQPLVDQHSVRYCECKIKNLNEILEDLSTLNKECIKNKNSLFAILEIESEANDLRLQAEKIQYDFKDFEADVKRTLEWQVKCERNRQIDKYRKHFERIEANKERNQLRYYDYEPRSSTSADHNDLI